MDLRFVALLEIDLDDSAFEIKAFTAPTRIEDSLVCFGILAPPWLSKKGGNLVIVDGFKRFRWVKKNGEQGAVCRIFSEDYDTAELWARRLENKIFEREINPAEKAQMISKLARIYGPDKIPRSFLSGLGVANRAEIVRRWELLSAGGYELLQLLASGEIAERAALQVADWDSRGRDSVLFILNSLRCSASIQVEIVERINEIALREQKAPADVIDAPRAKQILDSNVLNHRQKTQALRELLAEIRNPRLTSRQRRFHRQIEAVGLPPGVRIIHPVDFEGDHWGMQLSFTGPGELGKTLESTRSIVESGRLDVLFKTGGDQ